MAIDTDKPRRSCFQLRRIGKPATKGAVGNVLKLYKDITKFGRHSGNDHFIDSAELDCFISRWHAEVHRILHKGKDHYILKDKSLNGTYVNNHRVQGDHVLQPGEVVCFGHTNGKNLKPGEYAPQTDSEFEFVFEESTEDGEVEITQIDQEDIKPCITTDLTSRPDVLSHTMVPAPQGMQSSTASVDLLNNTVPQHGLVSESHKNTEPDVDQKPVIDVVHKTSTTTDAHKTSIAPNTHKSTTATDTHKPTTVRDAASPVLQDISNKSELSPPGLVPLDQILSQSGHSRTSANITVQVTQDKVFPTVSNQDPHTQESSSTTTVAPSNSSSSSSSITVTSNGEDTLLRPSFPIVRSEPFPEDHLHMAKSPDQTPHGDEVNQAGSTSRPNAPDKRKNKVPREMSAGMRKKRKLSGGLAKRQRTSSESEDDESWHYAGDKCDAFNCNRPTGAKVSWVQCDDCDAWYHTQCAGCSYDKIKKKNAEFHCGCV